MNEIHQQLKHYLQVEFKVQYYRKLKHNFHKAMLSNYFE